MKTLINSRKKLQMLDTSTLNEEEKKLFQDFYSQVHQHFKTEVIDDIEIPLHKLALFGNYSHYAYQQTLKIKEGSENSYITIVQVEYSSLGGKRTGTSFL